MVYNTSEILSAVKAMPCGRPAWDKGVKELAIFIAENMVGWEYTDIEVNSTKELEKVYLNGAANWYEYTRGGCLLIYNDEIAECLCSPAEYRRLEAKNFPDPNPRETWMDVQCRAAWQAWQMIAHVIRYNS